MIIVLFSGTTTFELEGQLNHRNIIFLEFSDGKQTEITMLYPASGRVLKLNLHRTIPRLTTLKYKFVVFFLAAPPCYPGRNCTDPMAVAYDPYYAIYPIKIKLSFPTENVIK